MAQKCVSEPRALSRALNKSGDIGGNKARALACRGGNDSEHGGERCKMIVGYLGARRAYAGEER